MHLFLLYMHALEALESRDRMGSCTLCFEEMTMHACRLAHKCGDMHALPDLCGRGCA